MANTISQRVYDFLKDFPPFSLLEKEVLERVSERVIVRYVQPKEIIFRQGESPKPFIYIVREGAVHLLRTEEEDRILMDECDEGDVFGIRPLIAQQPYSLTAMAVEETLIYAIGIEGFEKVLNENPKVSFYLATNFAAGVRNRFSSENKGRIFLDRDMLIDSNFRLVEVQSMETSRTPVTCSPGTRVRSAALTMTDNEVGSIVVVNDAGHPLGILTDRDLRKNIATGIHGLDTAVSTFMSKPVICVPPNITMADVQIIMVKHRIHHLCVTETGRPDSPVRGVISEHDLLVIQGNNPAILLKEIRKGKQPAELKQIREKAETLLRKYLHQEVSISFISTIMSEINDAIICQAIKLSEIALVAEGMGPAPTAYSWLGLGSEGREEQLLRTDQDNALVFADVPKSKEEATRSWFLQFAQSVTRMLNQVGFDFCPGDMMASNPSWCLSESEWKEQFSRWILNPNQNSILYSTIFFDFRCIFGDENMPKALSQHILDMVKKQTIFLNFLAKHALDNPPPLSFFRNFVVERSGEHKDEFDIKKRAMMPLTDAARILVLEAGVSGINNTFRRFEKMAELEPQNADIYISAANAYEILMRYRALQGLQNRNSGRYFKPDELNKMQRLQLRNCFYPISEIQSLLNLRFQLSVLR
ncbi:MAG: CBS domain-containing protein [Saprospiraceae bacterium]|nr:CBS domain-containing protein [Saprospiraceae bacterium]